MYARKGKEETVSRELTLTAHAAGVKMSDLIDDVRSCNQILPEFVDAEADSAHDAEASTEDPWPVLLGARPGLSISFRRDTKRLIGRTCLHRLPGRRSVG